MASARVPVTHGFVIPPHLDTPYRYTSDILSRTLHSIVVERALELGFISSIIDLVGTAYAFFIEGSLSPEVRCLDLK